MKPGNLSYRQVPTSAAVRLSDERVGSMKFYALLSFFERSAFVL